MKAQFIEKEGVAEWAVIPVNTYRRLVEDAEMLQDILDYDQAKRLIEDGEELIPSQVTFAILDGENPLKVWRTHRGLTQQEVAKRAKISPSYLSQLESGKRTGTTKVLKSIANVLAVRIDDLVAE
jgi:DNA-binding XRE family transcriptional regulator